MLNLICLICDTIEIKTTFKCHLPVYFQQERNFIDCSGYFMSEVAAILNFARLVQRYWEIHVCSTDASFYYVLVRHFAKFGAFVRPVIMI